MSRARWGIVVLSFTAMIAISVWYVWSEWGAGAGAPLVLPLGTHVVALGLVAVEIISRAVKLKLGASSVAIPLSFFTSVRTCLGGDFAAAITPARSGAEPARFLVLANAKLPTPSILIVLFLELLMELTSLLVVALGLWIAFNGSATELGLLAGVVVGYATFVLGLGMIGLLLARRSASGPPPGWVRSVGLNAGHWRRIQRALRQFRGSVTAVKSAKPHVLAAAFAASVVHIVAKLAVLPVIVAGMTRVADVAPLVLWPVILLYGGAVAPAPGGGGAVEFGFQHAFSSVLSPPVLAAALVWWRVYTLYLYILLGAWAGGTTVLRALRTDRAIAGG